MSRLDDIKNRGFNQDVDVEYSLPTYDWDLGKFTDSLPRNYEQIKDLLNSEKGTVPFVNFNTWVRLKKGLVGHLSNKEQLDAYFEEYKNFYLYMIRHSRLSHEYSEYKLEDNFDDEVAVFTGKESDMKVVDHSREISIGDVSDIRVDLSVNVVVERAKNIIEMGK